MNKSKSLKIIDNIKDKSLQQNPIRVNKPKDAKRLLSRLIYEFQKGTIEGRDAKDTAYLVSTFLQACKDIEFDERLAKIEEALNQ